LAEQAGRARRLDVIVKFGNSPLVVELEALSAAMFFIAFALTSLSRLKSNSIKNRSFSAASTGYVGTDLRRAALFLLSIALLILSAYLLSQSGPHIHHLLSAN
jgi:hypothetical protein